MHAHIGKPHFHSPTRVLRVSLAVTLAYIVLLLVAGIKAHSLALLSEAGHNASDFLALLLSLGAVYLQSRPPSATKTFGYHRAGVLAAFRACGRRKAGPPFEIASTTVRAVEPEEKARRRTKSPIVPAPTGSWCGTTARCTSPFATWKSPTATSRRIDVTNAYVGRANSRPDSRTPRRLASTITTRQASESATFSATILPY